MQVLTMQGKKMCILLSNPTMLGLDRGMDEYERDC